MQLHVLILDREVVDAAVGGRDPGGHLAGLDHLLHQALDEGAVALARQPFARPCVPLGASDDPAIWTHGNASPGTDRAAEAGAGQRELAPDAGFLDQPVPAFDADLAV